MAWPWSAGGCRAFARGHGAGCLAPDVVHSGRWHDAASCCACRHPQRLLVLDLRCLLMHPSHLPEFPAAVFVVEVIGSRPIKGILGRRTDNQLLRSGKTQRYARFMFCRQIENPKYKTNTHCATKMNKGILTLLTTWTVSLWNCQGCPFGPNRS